MTDNDPAFLWETEALRDSPRRSPTASVATPPPGGWATLKEAYLATGIPTGTLRKWARREHVASRVVDTPRGERRLLDMAAVVARAAELGREIAPVETGVGRDTGDVSSGEGRSEEAMAEVVDTGEVVAAGEAATEGDAEGRDTGDVGSGEGRSEGAVAEVVDTGEVVAAPSGTMIVPIDAWEKMLLQLGNLHEAGQQLAEARERAAKAETEAHFLRERLAEIRAGTGAERPEAPGSSRAVPSSEQQGTGSPGSRYVSGGEAWTPPPVAATWWQYAQRRWTQRRRRR